LLSRSFPAFVKLPRHPAHQAILDELVLERLSDLRILVFVLDLIGTFADKMLSFAGPTRIGEHSRRVKREKADRPDARVEMFVKPHRRRHEHAPFMPVDAFPLFTYLPHERKSLAVEDDDVETGAVPVCLLVRARGPSGKVQEHHRLGKPDSHAERVMRAIPALPKTALFFQRVNILPGEPLAHVRYKVRLDTLEPA